MARDLQVLRRAERLFTGRDEEITVLRTACDIALTKRDVGWALKKLRDVPQTSPLYRAARAAIAEVSLKYRNDQRAFIAAYLDIATVFKDYDAHVMCGDAFLRVLVRGRFEYHARHAWQSPQRKSTCVASLA
jgi:hypothetical protein